VIPRKPIYYKREFLNLPGIHAGAYVLASVEPDNWRHCVYIADCDRVVRLEFDLIDRRRRRNALRKADLLIDVMTGFRGALAETISGPSPQPAD
jgi:hypothetical protein